MSEIHCIIEGRVTGVAYRAYVQDAATELGVVGWIRNMPEGKVELVAQASPDVLKDFIEYLNEGSLMAKVEGVSVEWRTAKQWYDDFSIRH